jgi:hypothetical protein
VFTKKGSIEVALTRTQAFHRAERVLASLRARVRRSDLRVGLIEATFPWSWRSPGEIFTVHVSGEDGAIRIEVSSRMRTLMFGLWDLGKNADNVRRFLTAPAFESSLIDVQY